MSVSPYIQSGQVVPILGPSYHCVFRTKFYSCCYLYLCQVMTVISGKIASCTLANYPITNEIGFGLSSHCFIQQLKVGLG